MAVKRQAVFVLAFGLCAAAQAQLLGGGEPRVLHGGGATLPVLAWFGPSFFNADSPGQSPRLLTQPDNGSLFAAWEKHSLGLARAELGYCQSGNSVGRSVLTGALVANGRCDTFAIVPNGLGAPDPVPEFVALDLPLSANDYRLAATVRSAQIAPVQFPVLATAIGLLYNNAGISSRLALDDGRLCGLVSGAITDWNQLSAAYPSQAIRLVYRSDASAASFALSNHLSAVCGAGLVRTHVSFASSVSHLPAGAIAASSNAAVVDAIAATDGSLGYGELADALLRRPDLRYAVVGGFDPLLNLLTTGFTAVADMTLKDQPDTSGRPVLQPLSLAAGATAGCLQLIDPQSTARPAGYPIVAVSYLLGYNAGNADFRALRSLFGAAFDRGTQRVTRTVGAGTGYAFMGFDLGSTINGCIKR